VAVLGSYPWQDLVLAVINFQGNLLES